MNIVSTASVQRDSVCWSERCFFLKGSVWVEREAEAWLSHRADHALRSACQHQQLLIPTHLHHLPPCPEKPAPHIAGSHGCLHHHPWQGGDAPSRLLQGGQEPQQQHGGKEFWEHRQVLSTSVQITYLSLAFAFFFTFQWGSSVYLCYKKSLAKANTIAYKAGEVLG